MKSILFASLLGAATVLGSGPANAADQLDGVEVQNCWIRQMPAAVPSGGFFHLNNTSATAVTLVGVSSAKYGEIMLHETTEVDGVSKMSMVHQVEIAANSQLDFKPGGYHLMLEQPADDIHPGDQLELKFNFANGASISSNCEVKEPKDLSGMQQHQKH